MESVGVRERIWGKSPERQSTAFGAKARGIWGFLARRGRRESVGKKILAEGTTLASNRLRAGAKLVEMVPSILLVGEGYWVKTSTVIIQSLGIFSATLVAGKSV